MNTVSASAHPPPRVLIVDDDPNAVRLLGRVLNGVARITFATSGEEALRAVGQAQPDLVLLDAEMPGMDGFATCVALKADPATADIPVIFVTAFTDTDSETRALAIGAVDFIHKPVNPPVVLARVRTHLELKRQGDELRRLSAVDGLTGIANRRTFDDSLTREWRRAMRSREPLSLLLLDVDYFKRYNDTYGHPAGDACLRQLAQLLAGSAQRAGDLGARYGGEEFALILPHTRPRNAQGIAERLSARVAELAIPHRASEVASHVTVSIGVASLFVPCSPETAEASSCRDCSAIDSCASGSAALLAMADQALYTAKRQGRAQIACLAGFPDQIFPADGRDV